MMNSRLLRAAAAAVALAFPAPAADFSYYLLSLSYAPNFCAQPNGKKDARECGGKNPPGFVVYGLWPQTDHGRGPERCGPARPVAASIVQTMLRYIPTEALIQHEWATHGTCAGLTAEQYFSTVRRARDSVRIPPAYADVTAPVATSAEEIESAFGQANSALPRAAIRTACYSDGGLEEVRICFDRNLTPRACTGVPECTKSRVFLAPMRRP
jgi:ribonuclease T2